MNLGLRGMSSSMPANPFKLGNPFTPATGSPLDLSAIFESPRRRFHTANPFASDSQLDNNSALFTPRQKFTKLVIILRIMMALSRYEII